MKYVTVRALLLAALAAASLPSHAAGAEHDAHHAATPAAAAPAATGEVRRLDMEQNKITIRHGPLEKLGMPPMTMVFQVSDPALLKQVKAGDKIRFDVETKPDGALVVTRIERQ